MIKFKKKFVTFICYKFSSLSLMKTTICTLLILLVLLSCNTDKKISTTNKNPKNTTKTVLEGNWEMVGFYNYRDDKIVDSFKTNEGYRKVKMFNKNKVMWSKLVPSDSIEWFGFGSYTATDSTLTEVMQYGSKVMNTVIAEQKEFNYKLIVTKNTFSQISINEDGSKIYSENYVRLD